MSNFAEDIEAAADGEAIEAVTIGAFGWAFGDEPDEDAYGFSSTPIDPAKKGVVLSWAEARPLLDYEHDRGFGAPACHAVNVWTASKVMWVTQYDGATWLDSAPRNPTPGTPDMPGG